MPSLPLVILVLFTTAIRAMAQSPVCDPSHFKDAVTSTSASIAQLNAANTKTLQDTLSKWRAASGLSEQEFAAKAAPIIKDGITAAIDADNQALLAKIQSIGGGDAKADEAKCAVMVTELKTLMDKILANTTTRWQHMMASVNAASTAPIQAGAMR